MHGAEIEALGLYVGVVEQTSERFVSMVVSPAGRLVGVFGCEPDGEYSGWAAIGGTRVRAPWSQVLARFEERSVVAWSAQVSVTFRGAADAKAWAVLRAVAEERDMSVGALLHALGITEARSQVADRGERVFENRLRGRKKMTPQRQERLRELHAAELSDREIAERIGVATETVRHYRAVVFGLPVVRRGGPRTAKDLARVASIGREEGAAA